MDRRYGGRSKDDQEEKDLGSIHKTCQQEVLGLKWMDKTKLNVDGLLNILNARLAVKGCTKHWFDWHLCPSSKIWHNEINHQLRNQKNWIGRSINLVLSQPS